MRRKRHKRRVILCHWLESCTDCTGEWGWGGGAQVRCSREIKRPGGWSFRGYPHCTQWRKRRRNMEPGLMLVASCIAWRMQCGQFCCFLGVFTSYFASCVAFGVNTPKIGGVGESITGVALPADEAFWGNPLWVAWLRRRTSPRCGAIPENREFKKWKFSFFHLRHALWTSFDIFVVAHRVTNFLPKTCWHAIIFYRKKLNFHFLFSPILGYAPVWRWGWIGWKSGGCPFEGSTEDGQESKENSRRWKCW